MKKIVTTFLCVLCAALLSAQSPQAFKYQAVIRNNQGKVLVNQLVSLQISILQDNPMGDVVYMETHQVATNDYGIANITIGNGEVVTGVFADIPWGTSTHFVKTELDITGNRNYEFIGTSQLLSVPYALYAEKAGNAGNALDDFDKDPTNELQVLGLNGNILSLSNGNTIDLSKYLDNTDNQTLNIEGNKLVISGGNSVILSGNVDMDSDPTNELQILSYSNDTLYLSGSNYVVLPHNRDNDATNELQKISKSGTNINLSLNGGSFVLEDDNPENEIQTLTKSGNNILLSDGGTVTLNDDDATNEIQTLTMKNDTLTISISNSKIDMSDYMHKSEIEKMLINLGVMFPDSTNGKNGKGGISKAIFSISDTKKVLFSMGNLQYQASTNTWRFAEQQYDYLGEKNTQISESNEEWIDLFGWGTSGYHDTTDNYNVNFQPYSSSRDIINTTYNEYGYGPSSNMIDTNLVGTSALYDWGMYNPISNGENHAGRWRILTKEEWEYILFERPNAEKLCAYAKVNNVEGLLLLPDNWDFRFLQLTETNHAALVYSFTLLEWNTLQTHGAIFLPIAGYRNGIIYGENAGHYWSSSKCSDKYVYNVEVHKNTMNPTLSKGGSFLGQSVRLVQNIEHK